MILGYLPINNCLKSRTPRHPQILVFLPWDALLGLYYSLLHFLLLCGPFYFVFSNWEACSIGLRPCGRLSHWRRFFQLNDGLLHSHRHLFGPHIDGSSEKMPNSSTLGIHSKHFLLNFSWNNKQTRLTWPLVSQMSNYFWVSENGQNMSEFLRKGMDWLICI